MNTGPHIIEKVSVEMNVHNEQIAYEIKNRISSFLNEQVLPQIERILDELDTDSRVIRFDRFDFDLQLENWIHRDKIPAEFSRQLRKQLLDSIGLPLVSVKDGELSDTRQKGQFVKHEQNLKTSFLFFIEKGSLPWYGKRSYIDELLQTENWQQQLSDERFLLSLQTLLRQSLNAAGRFVLQLSTRQVLAFVQAAGIIRPGSEESVAQLLDNWANGLKKATLACLIAWAAKFPPQKKQEKILDVFREWLQEKAEGTELAIDAFHDHYAGIDSYSTQKTLFNIEPDDIDNIVLQWKTQHAFRRTKRGFTQVKGSSIENDPTIFSKRPVSSVNEKEPLFFGIDPGAIAVRNAGQVLFLPFLKTFFAHFSWLDSGGQILDGQRLRAVQAVHFCTTGCEDFFEADMVLEKFICGVNIETPVPAENLLNKEITAEATTMLTHMIKHWSALKNTSPDGLREMFFFREGKLMQQGNNFRLVVERKAQDVLLNQVPWNYSLAKLPWMTSLLTVEW